MAIKDWPSSERPREKLQQNGAGALSDAELLAIFLRTGAPGVSAVELARQLLLQFGGLRPLLDAPESRRIAAKGLGPAKLALLAGALELGRRYLAADLHRTDVLTSPSSTRNYLKLKLSSSEREIFACLFLDTRHRVIAYEELFHGTIDSATVHAREVVKMALKHNAAAVILVHNHPSGVAEPSRSDEALTRRLKEALALVEIRILDHFVIGHGEPVSMAERGLI